MKKLLLVVMMLSVAFVGCANWRTAVGGAIGAGAGGAIGGLIGHKLGNTAAGAIIGAAVGGTAGAAIGHYMDKQAAEIQGDIKDAKVERVGEGIKITFASGILFEVNKADLTSAATESVNKLAVILNKYPDTKILVEGHTDSTGTHELNMKLSENRALSVANSLKSSSVTGDRITTAGYGPDQPVADNSTVEGRQANRRVEVAIFANDKLIKAAERNDQLTK
jgi:outer membrane protein OmpA-like peptidoglycan-associated protein